MKFYRNSTEGKIAGVCLGLGERLGIKVGIVRLLFILSTLFLGPFSLVVYLFLMIGMTDQSTGSQLNTRSSQDFLSYQLDSLDLRIKKIESYVTSERFSIENRYRQLERS